MAKRDWKNEADYEFTKDLDLNGWAWEFLRRNPEYRKDWKKELPIYLKSEQEYRSNPKFKESPVWGKPIISENDPHFRINPHKPDYLYIWGLYLLINPDQDKPFGPIFYPTSGQVILGSGLDWLSGKAQEQFISIPEGKIAVIFDLTKSINQQIRKFEKDLAEWQRYFKEKRLKVSATKTHKQNWTNYIRILDAEAEGISRREIAKIIFSKISDKYPDYQGSRMVKDSSVAAQKMMRRGYFAII